MLRIVELLIKIFFIHVIYYIIMSFIMYFILFGFSVQFPVRIQKLFVSYVLISQEMSLSSSSVSNNDKSKQIIN